MPNETAIFKMSLDPSIVYQGGEKPNILNRRLVFRYFLREVARIMLGENMKMRTYIGWKLLRHQGGRGQPGRSDHPDQPKTTINIIRN